jgi:KUP system potassium uptake protein
MDSTNKKLGALTFGAIGIVFGDIGTSPLYALKECFKPGHGVVVTEATVFGILSLMFWAVVALVTVKYLVLMMRADNKGEGGILALTSLAQRCVPAGKTRWLITALGMFGAAMFYGDSIITPAMTVLSAVEGLEKLNPSFGKFIIPISIGILVALFLVQRKGTTTIGRFFGPIMVLWFVMLAGLGIAQIAQNPKILMAINPIYSFEFLFTHKFIAFVTLGAVVLCVTGGEALYADMGHFGKKPIRCGWFTLVWPALILNYFGQGALLLANPEAVSNPFYSMMPNWLLAPMIVLATAAAVIASQAVISGAFSLTRQAIQLGYLPRFAIKYTSDKEYGQIYVPFVNWALLIGVISLVVGFKNSDNLAAAYGIAVTLTMLIDTLLLFVIMTSVWKWNRLVAIALTTVLLLNDVSFFLACALRVAEGGWVPLLVGISIFTIMSTWRRGREILRNNLNQGSMPMQLFIDSMAESTTPRVPGTGIFLTGNPEGVPNSLLHNLKHNKVLHERVVLLSVVVEDIPFVPKEDYVWIENMKHGFWRVTGHYGFKENPDIPTMLQDCSLQFMHFEMMETSFFVNRETLIATPGGGMAIWREHLFVWMSHLAAKASDYFRIPANRVVELGSQVEI